MNDIKNYSKSKELVVLTREILGTLLVVRVRLTYKLTLY